MAAPREIIAEAGTLPWDRLFATYGRATRVPEMLETLCGAQHALACDWLMRELEHQDTIAQATPYATWYLLDLLPMLDSAVQRGLLPVLHRILRVSISVSEDFEAPSEKLTEAPRPNEHELWPPFVGEDEDEAWIESDEFHRIEENYVAWHAATWAIFEAKRVNVECLVRSDDKDVRCVSAAILKQLKNSGLIMNERGAS